MNLTMKCRNVLLKRNGAKGAEDRVYVEVKHTHPEFTSCLTLLGPIQVDFVLHLKQTSAHVFLMAEHNQISYMFVLKCDQNNADSECNDRMQFWFQNRTEIQTKLTKVWNAGGEMEWRNIGGGGLDEETWEQKRSCWAGQTLETGQGYWGWCREGMQLHFHSNIVELLNYAGLVSVTTFSGFMYIFLWLLTPLFFFYFNKWMTHSSLMLQVLSHKFVCFCVV